MSIDLNHSAMVQALEAGLRALVIALQAGDADEAVHHAHRLVGACEVLETHEVANLARVVEWEEQARLGKHSCNERNGDWLSWRCLCPGGSTQVQ